MSLTSFIRIPEVKAIFRKEFPLKQTRLEGELKALNTEERGVGGLMRIKYIIGIQYVQ